LLATAGLFYQSFRDREARQDVLDQIKTLPLPSATKSLDESKSPEASLADITIREQLNLGVPFTSQAPHAVWDLTHEEACEEASMLMASRYFNQRKINDATDAEEGIGEIIAWEKENLGFFESTTAEETSRVIREMLGLRAEVVESPSAPDIQKALNEDKLVLVPAAGRKLANPFYKSPGPLYHMLVIKGYSDNQFITNDPGTKNGENYPYKFETILSANHDWNGGNVDSGQKVMIFVSK